jgi:uncharacterized protein (TIGR02611 family)
MPTSSDPRPKEPPKAVRRLQERRETHRDHGLAYRMMFLVAGVVILLTGVAMLALPGPAFLVIPVGLAILSLEFAWAGRLLDTALEQADKAQTKAAETSTRQRVATAVVLAFAAVAFALVAIRYDIPLLPV